jgi:hypothetical protein
MRVEKRRMSEGVWFGEGGEDMIREYIEPRATREHMMSERMTNNKNLNESI